MHSCLLQTSQKREKHGQTDRQTDRQAGRQAGRQTDRQTDTHTHTEARPLHLLCRAQKAKAGVVGGLLLSGFVQILGPRVLGPRRASGP